MNDHVSGLKLEVILYPHDEEFYFPSGYWEIKEPSGPICVIAAYQGLNPSFAVKEQRARELAYLFAAAPDLLEACEALLREVAPDDGGRGYPSWEVIGQARAAIAKAKGDRP